MSRSCRSSPPLAATVAAAANASPEAAAVEMAAASTALDDAAALGYGAALRSEFGLEDSYTQLNHGSFGVCPPTVNDNRKALLGAGRAVPEHTPHEHCLSRALPADPCL